jgi:glucose/arabinose dehydrogenase
MVLGVLAALAAASTARAAPVTLAQIGTFAKPVFITAPPEDTHRVLVVEQDGTIRLLVDGALLPQPFLDITSLVTPGYERGLLSLAFAPDYASSGRFYVYYTARRPPAAHMGDIQIDEYRRSDADPNVADLATRRPILSINHFVHGNHNGGQLAFGPDGMLWAAPGDGGGAGDPLRNAQNPNTLLGKLLRIDPRPDAPSLAPADNPFTAGGGAPEVWAIGLRNPFRFSFDRATGDLVIGDVGQAFAEEIDFAPLAGGLGRAANYGWNVVEGTYRYDDLNQSNLQPAAPGDFPPGHLAPVIQHLHSEGWQSITGGYVVRDTALPELLGKYVYGDYGKGDLYAATLAGGAADDAPIGLHVDQISSFGEDGCGRLYVASLTGPVYRLEASGACSVAPSAPPARDVRPPELTLRAARRQRVLRKGFVSVRLRCDEQCAVRAHGRIRIARARAAAATTAVPVVRRTLAAGATVPLRLALPRAMRAQLARAVRRKRTVEALLGVDATDAAANRSTRRARVRVVR